MYTLLDPKFAVEPISEVTGASKAHLEVVKRNVTNVMKQGSMLPPPHSLQMLRCRPCSLRVF